MTPALRRWRPAENQHRMRSELVRPIGEWLPEALAFTIATTPSTDDRDAPARLKALEAGLADRAVALTEGLLRLGIASESPCYEPNAIGDRVGAVLELAGLIEEVRQDRKEKDA